MHHSRILASAFIALVFALLHCSVANAVADDNEFIYDPIVGESHPLQEVDAVKAVAKTDLVATESFTIEGFATLSGMPADLKGREYQAVFSIEGEDSFYVGIRKNPPPHSYIWWMARVSIQGKPPIDLTRNRYRGLTMVQKETRRRHVAFVWDADQLTASCYLDYQLLSSSTFEATPKWDLTRISFGGVDEGKSKKFAGQVQSVRVTDRNLKPWEFLRISKSSLKNITFAPEKNPALPEDYGHVDVRLHYGAIGDGIHDDTEAIRRAFADNTNRVPLEYKTVYFPAGTYLISDTIQFSRFMVVRGAGSDQTTIQLKDQSEGFADTAIPKPAFAVGYDWPYVGRTRKMRAGNVIGNYIFDLAIDTGKQNPAALGLDFHCNNIGGVENVAIHSGDGEGLVGLDLRRPWPGPCLIKNVEITGFDYGIAAGHREYSLVFSGIKLRNQLKAAIQNNGNVLSMEDVQSTNRVPALQNRNGGLVVMINSELSGGAASATAIESENASLYLRNVSIDGYGTSVEEAVAKKDEPRKTLREVTQTTIDEYITGPRVSAFGEDVARQGSLKLPIKSTPTMKRPPISQWVNVEKFANLVVDGDWAPAIQAAIDSGATVVYFPHDVRCVISQDVIVRGNVRSFFGGSPKQSIGNGQSDAPENGPAIVIDPSVTMFDIEMLGLAHVRHQGPTTFVVRHSRVDHISTSEATGPLFIEDSGGKWRFSKHQRVWGRQLNPETKGIPEIINDGGTLWMLGMKTEYLSTKIVNRGGAQTELLGGLMYPVHAVTDESLPMFINEDSDISLIHGVSVYKKNHRIYMRDSQDGETREYTDWHWTTGRPLMNLYRSNR